MNPRQLARVFSLFAFLVISAGLAVAQTAAPSPTPVPKKNQRVIRKGPQKRNPSPTPSPVPYAQLEPVALATPAPLPLRISYFGEYIGPRFSNFDLAHTQAPGSKNEQWAYFNHYGKIGYLVSKDVFLGFQFRAVSSFDPDPENHFYWEDIRIMASWARMISTDQLDMTGIIKLELPTTDYTRAFTEIFSVKIEQNWILKTPLRNWHFSAITFIQPYFYRDPVNKGKGREDLEFGIEPYITMDLIPNMQLLFQGYFQAIHNYVDAPFTYRSGDTDTMNIGPLFTINRHLNANIAIRFYPDNLSFNDTSLYLSTTAVF